mmetsp:Transcript_26443/g.58229  ORF Transcript_26443/g.58229 Transcript_26443/m.58229 type:complete len:242 (-) Transcript_26443:440-1165(-)
MNLRTIATFALGKSTETATQILAVLNIAQGSVIDFSPPKSESPLESVGAIVNAANEGCLGGGGVDGAINNAGGSNLRRDREALPELVEGSTTRCKTGRAVVTGPGDYGRLRVEYVVHAVGPAYSAYESQFANNDDDKTKFSKPDSLLRSAYKEALERCKESGVTDVGFSLLSAGVYRGNRTLVDVLAISVRAIQDWIAEQQQNEEEQTLQSITLCAFTRHEVDALLEACRIVFGNNDGSEL